MSRIDLSKIKLSQLRAFAAVAKHHNFSEAAAHLDMTQSSVSHAVAVLESELGVAILPYLATLPIPKSVQVRPLPDELTRRLAAVTREDVLHPASIFLFLDMVKRSGQSIFSAESLTPPPT